MGIEVQKSAPLKLFNFARVRATSQPHMGAHEKMIPRDHIIFSGVERYILGSKKIKKTPCKHYYLAHCSPWRELFNTYALQFWWSLKSVIKNQNISYLQSNNRILLIPHQQMFIILNQVKAKVILLLQV